MSNFDSTPLTCDPALFLCKNIQNIAKSNGIFPGKGRRDKDFILTYLDSSVALKFFRITRGVEVRPKVLTLGPSLFHNYSNRSKNFLTAFLFARVLPLARISAILDHTGRARTQKLPNRIISWMLNRFAKMFNLTTTNAILMKLTTIMYLHESVNRKALRARNSFFSCLI